MPAQELKAAIYGVLSTSSTIAHGYLPLTEWGKNSIMVLLLLHEEGHAGVALTSAATMAVTQPAGNIA